MRLCINCVNYGTEGDSTVCLEGHWSMADSSKSKILNPMMFDCMEYEAIDGKPAFGDDHIFDLFTELTK